MEAFEWYLANEGTAMGIEEAGQLLANVCATPLSAKTWIRCCDPVCQSLMSMSPLR